MLIGKQSLFPVQGGWRISADVGTLFMGVGHIFQESILYIIFADSRGAHVCNYMYHTYM